MRTRKYFSALPGFLALCVTATLHAQTPVPKGFSAGLFWMTGDIIKHTSKLTFDRGRLSNGLELHLQWQTFGRHAWEAGHHYPQIGLAATLYDFGNERQLGQAVAVYPEITLSFWKGRHSAAFFRLGSGISYVTRHYDRFTNPLGNAIGSAVNNVTAIKLGATCRLGPRWQLYGGAGLTHYSNGGSQMPNFGINVGGGFVGLHFTPNPVAPAEFLHPLQERPDRRWGVTAHGALAFIENNNTIGGPKYPVYVVSLAGMYHWDRYNRLLVGLEYEQNRWIYEFGRHTLHFPEPSEAFLQASRFMVFAGEEFLFGDFSILLQAGTYFGPGFLIPDKIYNKMAFRYYLPPLWNTGSRLYTGICLKSHRINAEYISWSWGAAF